MCSEFYSKFTIQEKVGEGTFSEVLKCQSIVTKKTFAVKRLKKQFKHLSEAQSLPELLVLEKLTPHPNVLPMLEYIFNPKEGRLFMIFELMDMSLYDLIETRKRCLPESKVKSMFYQILKGVDHLHSHGIFHRDIKPENILLKKTVVKLADLGSVRGVSSQQPYTDYISTRWYRAPECIHTAGLYGPKMDIWACGCVFYELLTSKPIFPGANEIDQLTKIHQVTGTPNTRVMMKMRRNQSRLRNVKFTMFPPINLSIMLPFTSENGKDILKRMLVYDPDIRCNVRRLLEHRYFNDLRDMENMIKPYEIRKQWSHPMVLKEINTENKPKTKPKDIGTYTKKAPATKLMTNSWAPSTNISKVVVSTSKSKPNNKVLLSNEKNKQPSKSPARKTKKTNSSSSSTKQEVKLSSSKTLKMKTKSVGILPIVSCKQQMLSKSHIPRLFKDKNYLPPISEM